MGASCEDFGENWPVITAPHCIAEIHEYVVSVIDLFTFIRGAPNQSYDCAGVNEIILKNIGKNHSVYDHDKMQQSGNRVYIWRVWWQKQVSN